MVMVLIGFRYFLFNYGIRAQKLQWFVAYGNNCLMLAGTSFTSDGWRWSWQLHEVDDDLAIKLMLVNDL